MYNMSIYKGLPGVVDGGCLLLVIGGSGIDQVGVRRSGNTTIRSGLV